ncbi:MAG TPA: DUF4350 domain-containing protein [Actinomycetota bacterium]|nr:DUF4350 domain-containing protein [Actinomycetota bacterium]
MRARAVPLLAVAALVVAPAPALAQSGPDSSSYTTGPNGLAAYASLLEHFEFDVGRLRIPLAQASLDGAQTIVLLDAPALEPAAAGILRDFVDGGGRLVTGGASPSWIDELVPDPPSWDTTTSTQWAAPAPGPGGATTLESAAEGRWTDPGEGTTVAGDVYDALAVEVEVGEGVITLLADASPLQNRLLDHADNAAFAVALAGEAPRPVVFVESVHGYGPPRGLSAFPAPWRWSFGGFVLAAALWMWSRGRRLGPPEETERVLPPPRRAYVEALAATLARARRREGGSG